MTPRPTSGHVTKTQELQIMFQINNFMLNKKDYLWGKRLISEFVQCKTIKNKLRLLITEYWHSNLRRKLNIVLPMHSIVYVFSNVGYYFIFFLNSRLNSIRKCILCTQSNSIGFYIVMWPCIRFNLSENGICSYKTHFRYILVWLLNRCDYVARLHHGSILRW